MSEDILAQIKAASSQLNSAAENASKALTEINDELRSAGVGLEVFFDYPISRSSLSDDPRGNRRRKETYIGYAKVDGAWCLATRTEVQEVDSDDELVRLVDISTIALSEADRQVRIAALQVMPMLLKLVLDRIESASIKLDCLVMSDTE